jgi:hypothetical protein
MTWGRDSSKNEAGLSIFHRLVALRRKVPALIGILISPLLLAGCSQTTGSISATSLTDSITPSFLHARPYRYSARDRECLERAMFFESNRSSREGMIAVGTVVMNRLRSGQHGDTICAVVGEPRQFAPGVLTKRMDSAAMPDVQEAAEAVLKGERAPKLRNAMHFHTAGLKFPYRNMHYVEVAGGNAFYEKRGRDWQPLPPEGTMIALAGSTPTAPASTPAPTMVASADPFPEVTPATDGRAIAPSEAPDGMTQLAASSVPLPTPRAAFMATGVAPQAGRQDRAIQLAMQEPSPARFGASDFDTAQPKAAAPVIAAAMPEETQPSLSFQSTPDDTSAIAALIMSETRPVQQY